MHNREGKILNPTQKIKLNEFEYIHKFIPRFQMMGYAHIEFEDAYEVIHLPGNKYELAALESAEFDRLKKVLTDKMNSVVPIPELSPLEKENQELKARMNRMESMMEKLTPKEITEIPLPAPSLAEARKDFEDPSIEEIMKGTPEVEVAGVKTKSASKITVKKP